LTKCDLSTIVDYIDPHDFYPGTPTETLIRWHRTLLEKEGTPDWDQVDAEDLRNQSDSLTARGITAAEIWPEL
jgi:hypothetical protein